MQSIKCSYEFSRSSIRRCLTVDLPILPVPSAIYDFLLSRQVSYTLYFLACVLPHSYLGLSESATKQTTRFTKSFPAWICEMICGIISRNPWLDIRELVSRRFSIIRVGSLGNRCGQSAQNAVFEFPGMFRKKNSYNTNCNFAS